MKVELVKQFQIEIGVIALHPSGFFAAVGFIDLLRLMQVQLDNLKVTKAFNFPKCTQLKFSSQGHLLAAAHGKVISLICIFTFEVTRTLKGHNGSILSLSWSTDDSVLASGGDDGAIYKWSTVTGERIEEIVQKGIHYRSLSLTNDSHSVFAITNTGLIREMCKSDIVSNCMHCLDKFTTFISFVVPGVQNSRPHSIDRYGPVSIRCNYVCGYREGSYLQR